MLAGSDPLFANQFLGQVPKNLRLDPDTVQENQTVGSIVSRLFTDGSYDPQGRDVYASHFERGGNSQNDYFFDWAKWQPDPPQTFLNFLSN